MANLKFGELFTKDVVAQLMSKLKKPVVYGGLESVEGFEKASVINNKAMSLVLETDMRKPFTKQFSKGVLPMLYAFLPKEMGGLNRKGFLLNAEMGSGKTTMSFLSVWCYFKMAPGLEERGMKVIMITDGSKLLKQMQAEAEACVAEGYLRTFFIKNKTNMKKGEVTIEDAASMEPVPGVITVFVMSKDTGKGEWKVEPMKSDKRCPSCGHFLGGMGDFKYDLKADLKSSKTYYRCPHCGDAIWDTVGGQESVAKKLKKIARKSGQKFVFDFFLMDEAHKMQNPESLQSKTYRAVVKLSYRVVLMTGTLSNGYASSIFHILYPVFPEEMKKMNFTYDRLAQFVEFFGSSAKTSTTTVQANGTRVNRKISELPQINYRITSIILTLGVTITTEDLDLPMPKFSEQTLVIEQEDTAKRKMEELNDAIKLSKSRFDSLDQRMHQEHELYILNNLCKPYTVSIKGQKYDRITNSMYDDVEEVHFNPLPENYVSRKEEKLLELIYKETRQDRRIIVYTDFNESNLVQERLVGVISRAGYDVTMLPKSIKPEDILEYVTNFKGQVIILPQRRVETGLNLVMFHTVVFYELCSQIRVVQQAKVRPWRPIGQEKDVRVFYLMYRGAQEKVLATIGEKMASTTVSSGKQIMADSLAALYDYQAEQTENVAKTSDIIMELRAEEEAYKASDSELELKFQAYLISLSNKDEDVNLEAELELLKDEHTTVQETQSYYTAEQQLEMCQAQNLFLFDEEFMASYEEAKNEQKAKRSKSA